MKIAHYIFSIVTIIALVVLVASATNLSSNFKSLLNSSQITCNSSNGARGGCLPPHAEPDLAIVITSGAIMGGALGWAGHSYFIKRKSK